MKKMRRYWKRIVAGGLISAVAVTVTLAVTTVREMRELPENLHTLTRAAVKPQLA